MLPQLGAAIDRVYKGIHSHVPPKKRLLIIVGNGIRDVANILNDDKVKIEARKRGYVPGSRRFLEFKWRLFEYARYYTANSLPTYAHCCIYRMVADKACLHLITTNYDLYFDSIWTKHRGLQIDTNPVAARGEYLWDNYYSRKSRSGRRCYWKIHGSLTHGVFRTRSSGSPATFVLARLPRMAVPTNRPTIARAYGLSTTCPFLGYEATEYPLSVFPRHSDVDATFEPFIDWTYSNDRSLFSKEISAVEVLLKRTAEIDSILLIGFRGYYNRSKPNDPWNEELIPVLESLLRKGFDNIFMAVHRRQAATVSHPTSEFLRNRLIAGRASIYDDAGLWMRDLATRHTYRFPYNIVDAEHAKWANYYYLSDAEAAHI
jgi:hypothetical protein